MLHVMLAYNLTQKYSMIMGFMNAGVAS